MPLELGILWAAVALYLVGSLLGWVGLIWRSERALHRALLPTGLALAVHAASLLLRWTRIGHGPYVNAFEVLSASTWVAAGLLLAVVAARRDARAAVGPVLGVNVLLLGWGVLSSPEVVPLPPTFKGVWLVLHILFAKIAYGSILIASGCAIVHLWRARAAARGATAPPPEELTANLRALDELAARLVAFGFVSVSFMIVAGAIWAYHAWGRYWGWDPVETWSLFTWLAYGLFLHARFTYGLRGRRAALCLQGLLALSILAFFVIAIVLPTVHTEFMVR